MSAESIAVKAQLHLLTIKPEFAYFLNPLNEEEKSSLKASILSEGCRDAIVTWGNTIVDGHHRYQICIDHGIPFDVKRLDFKNDLEAMEWMDSIQRARRNEIPYARAERALRLKAFYSIEARKNQAHGETAPGQALSTTLPKAFNTRKEVSEKANVSEGTISKVERIHKSFESNPNKEIQQQLRNGDISINEVFKKVVKSPHVSNNSGENEWFTPTHIVESARKVMGSIDLDPASNELANKVIQAKKYYTEKTSGLDKVWTGNVWLNPPYSQPLISQFSESVVKNLTEMNQLCFLSNNATDTVWLHSLLARCDRACFVKGRISFVNEQGEKGGQPLQGQVILYFGRAVVLFEREFSKYGVVLPGGKHL